MVAEFQEGDEVIDENNDFSNRNIEMTTNNNVVPTITQINIQEF